MFKNKIVIGQNYLFDVLNETNLASMTTLVTVIKKVKYNKYIVMSVNNNSIFETKAKYLTPYINPKEASVIRCHYGTTEFNDSDLNTLQDIGYCFGILNDICDNYGKMYKVGTLEDFKRVKDRVLEIKKLTEDLKNKIKQYVDISNYKDSFELIGFVNSKRRNEQKMKETKNSFDQDIKEAFDINVSDYLDGYISYNQMICNCCDFLSSFIKKKFLVNQNPDDKNDHISFSSKELEKLITNIRDSIINDNVIVFLTYIDKKDNLCVKAFFDKDEHNESYIKSFIYDEVYPICKDTNTYFTPEYNFLVLYLNLKGGYRLK